MGGIFLLQINTRKMHNLAQYFVSTREIYGSHKTCYVLGCYVDKKPYVSLPLRVQKLFW